MSRWAAILLLVVFFGAASRATAATVKLQTVSAATLSARGNRWNAAIAGFTNSTYQAVKADLFVRLDRMSNVEFVEPIWLPARSDETISLPVFCPFPRAGKKVLDYTAWLATGASGHIIARNTGSMFTPAARYATMAVTDGNDQTTADLAVQMRKQEGLTSVIAYTDASHMPYVPSEYDGVYALFAARRHMALSGPQRNALRRWLVSGGRLWIQSQRVSDHFGRALLGPAWTIVKVGQTHTATLHFSGRGMQNSVLHLKKAIHMVYLLAPGYTTLAKVNGWPAVMVRRVGLGRVYICAVNGRGMLNKTKMGGAVLWPIVRNFYSSGGIHIPGAILKHNASSQIGYRISGRMIIGVVLVGLTVLLLLAAFVLGRKDKLERLAPAAIALAVVAGVILIINGKLNRGRVKLTLSSYQIACAAPDQHLLAISGFASIFSPKAQAAELTTSSGLQLNPKTSFAKQSSARVASQNNQKFQWHNIQLPSGAAIDIPFTSTHANRLIQPVVGRFGPAGLEISGQETLLANLRDMAIAAPRGALALARAGSGTRLAGPAQILPAGQFIQSSFLTRSQQNHNTIEARLYKTGGPAEPALLGWPNAAMPLLHLTHNPVRMNQTLLVMPLEMRATAAGTHVELPWPYLPYRLVPGSGQHAPAPVYNTRKHRWLKNLSSPANIFLRFQLPRQVLPLKLTSAVLTIKLSAPGRPVSVMASEKGKWVTVSSASNGGTMVLHLTPAALSAIGPAGGWKCEIIVGGTIDPSSTWHVTTVRLTAAGTVQ